MIRFRKALFPIGLLLGAIAIAGWLRATKPSSPANPITEHIWTVDVLPVVVADIQPEMRLFAQIVAGREVELRALVAGTVESVGSNFANGGIVEKGETLVTIDSFFHDRDLMEQRALLRQAMARLDELTAKVEIEGLLLFEDHTQLAISQDDLARYEELVGEAVSERKLDKVRLAASRAQSQVLLREQQLLALKAQINQQIAFIDKLEASVERAARKRMDTQMRAPFGGYLTDIMVNEGMQLSMGDSVAQLIDANQLEARIFLSHKQFSRAFSGGVVNKPAIVNWKTGSKLIVFNAVVERLESEIDPALGGVHMYARLDSNTTNTAIRPGAFVEVIVPDRVYEKVVRLPQEALHEGSIVYAIVGGRLEERMVDLVGRDGDWVLLKGALVDGEDIVLTRFTEIGPGVSVTIAE